MRLPRAPLLTGTVYHEARRSDERLPVSGTLVRALALSPNGQAPPNRAGETFNRSVEVAVDPLSGQFSLPLDPGGYDIVVKPPVDSGFAWQLFRDFSIGEQVTLTGQPVTRHIRLDAPILIRGQLVYRLLPDAGAPEAGALDEARITARAVFDSMSGAQRSVVVGSTQTSTGGYFELLIGPSLRRGLL